jgi:hypothetical protein
LFIDILLEFLGSGNIADSSGSDIGSSGHFVRSCLAVWRLLLDRYTKKHFNFFQIVLKMYNLKVIYKNLHT